MMMTSRIQSFAERVVNEAKALVLKFDKKEPSGVEEGESGKSNRSGWGGISEDAIAVLFLFCLLFLVFLK